MHVFLPLLLILAAQISAPLQPFLDNLDRQYTVAYSQKPLLELEQQILHEDKPLETDALTWRLARIYFSLGKRSADDAAHRYFSRCVESAERTIRINPRQASGYFYRGLCNGSIGRLEGIWSSLDKIGPLKDDMEMTIRLDPTIAHGGAHRALGKLYFELPRILGGNIDKSIRHLQEAVRLGPSYGDNYLFLAEAYRRKNENALARETLADMRKNVEDDPANPETVDRVRRAALLQQELNNVSP